MKIVWATSECFPFAKTGGLADVSSSLPKALAARGHEVMLIMPFYPQVFKEKSSQFSKVHTDFLVPFGFHQSRVSQIWKWEADKNLTYYFVQEDGFFDRPTLYDWQGKEFEDNAQRFMFFSRAVMDLIIAENFTPDILHLNDWHTALCSVYLKSRPYVLEENFAKCRSVLTIHNIGYQGVFPKELFEYSGLGWEVFNHSCLEYHDQINLLKGGILCADMVNTVSPSYASEILMPEFAFTLESALQHVNWRGKLRGILNGIELEEWNPSTDRLIPANYHIADLSGKAICKTELQKEFGLPLKPDTPVFGVVSRFAHQKGLDVLAYCIEGMLQHDEVQFVILGSGDPELEGRFSYLASQYPEKLATYVGYSEKLSHMIEAGSDLFVMPSRYEPCGLNQMYSMRYGTLPVVRGTGGLEDTVENYDAKRINDCTGFKFYELSGDALAKTLQWAADIYHHERENFDHMRRNGMQSDFSWNHTASQYEQLYEDALN